jgi:hypothetical protein
MKEKPILFSTPMIRAILEGRKSQTRRIIKFPNGIFNETPYCLSATFDGELLFGGAGSMGECFAKVTVKTKYKPGDILWVKEMFYAYGIWLRNGYTKSGKQKWRFLDTTFAGEYRYFDNLPAEVLPNSERDVNGWFKRNSLFMPYKACRIRLEVINDKVERLNDISEEDAIAEGTEMFNNPCAVFESHGKYYDYTQRHRTYTVADRFFESARASYLVLWEKINGSGSWEKNPWVWVIGFKRI